MKSSPRSPARRAIPSCFAASGKLILGPTYPEKRRLPHVGAQNPRGEFRAPTHFHPETTHHPESNIQHLSPTSDLSPNVFQYSPIFETPTRQTHRVLLRGAKRVRSNIRGFWN